MLFYWRLFISVHSNALSIRMNLKYQAIPLKNCFLAACLLAGFHHPCMAEEETVKLEIESEPTEFAAALLIAYAQGNTPSDKDIAEERKRTRFGAGETVKLTLTGKKALIGDPDTLEWKIEEGKGDQWATISTRKDDPTLLADVVMTIKPDLVFEPSEPKDPAKELGDTPLKTEGTVNVQVLQGGEVIAEREFTAVLPKQITAEHENRPISIQDGKDGALFAKDGDWEPVGASAVLKLTYHPTDVSFHKLATIEVDHGTIPFESNSTPLPAGFVEVHMPNATATLLSKENSHPDLIGTRKTKATVQSALSCFPVGFTWVCGFYTALERNGAEKRLARIGIYEQKFLYDDHKKKDINSVETTVSKLDCKVSRLTGGKHKFTKE